MKLKKSKNIKISFRLESKEKQTIRKLLSKGKESARVIRRAQVLKLFDKGYTSPKIAKIVDMTAVSIRSIGWRYLEGGLERALYDSPRPGNKRLLSEKQSSQIIALACSNPPAGRDRWTIELLTEKTIEKGIIHTVGRETIRILLKTHDIKPWQEKNVVHPGTNT